MSTENQSILDILDGGSFDQTDAVTNMVVFLRFMHKQISEMKFLVTGLMDQNEKTKTKLDLALSYNAKIDSLSTKVDLALSTQGKLDKVVAANLLMAARVDATATPVTSFVATFNNNI